jgi:hypothetical protein
MYFEPDGDNTTEQTGSWLGWKGTVPTTVLRDGEGETTGGQLLSQTDWR